MLQLGILPFTPCVSPMAFPLAEYRTDGTPSMYLPLNRGDICSIFLQLCEHDKNLALEIATQRALRISIALYVPDILSAFEMMYGFMRPNLCHYHCWPWTGRESGHTGGKTKFFSHITLKRLLQYICWCRWQVWFVCQTTRACGKCLSTRLVLAYDAASGTITQPSPEIVLWVHLSKKFHLPFEVSRR